MPDLVQTPVNVRVLSATQIDVVVSGEALAQGNVVYADADAKHWKTVANDTPAKARAVGFVMTPASAADKYCGIVKLKGSKLGLGAVLAPGQGYIVSDTPGAVAELGDQGSGWWLTILGFALDADQFVIDISYSPAALP